MKTERLEYCGWIFPQHSAAFDTIDHNILIDRSSRTLGIRGTALSWLQSFISDRKQYVAVGTEQSEPASCTSGVPQASVLSPLLFAMYITSRRRYCSTRVIINMPMIRSYTWPFDRVPT